MSNDRLEPYNKVQIQHAILWLNRDILVYIDQLELYQFSKMIIMFRVGTQFVFRKLITVVHDRLELISQFKYSTLLCHQNRDLFSIYRPTTAISVHKNDQHVQGWNPTTNFLKNEMHCGMTYLNLLPKFKYSTLLCSQIRDIFSIYRQTGASSVHKHDQHFQVWNSTTNFFENCKNSKKENIFNIFFKKKRIKIELDVCSELFGKTPIYITILIYLFEKLLSLRRNININLHYQKSPKN